jgi:iron(III) transport system substrate-binding protein
MRNFIILIFILITSSLNANEWEDRQVFTSGEATQSLKVLSSTDTTFFAPIIKSFLEKKSKY